jgi:glycosyltransferase involved in cell wall biosynthesis
MNVPFSIEHLRSGGRGINTSGGWMTTLLGQMLKETNLRFACVAFGNTPRVKASHDDRIDCFVVPQRMRIPIASQYRSLQKCRDLVAEWKPDLIHIHGTENAYGLLSARGMVKCPTVISLQGLLGPYSEWYHYFGNRRLKDIIQMHRWLEIPALRGHWIGYRKIQKSAKREKAIIKGNRFFIGRTAWDKAYIRAQNPSAHYFYGSEMIREAFWQKRWTLGEAQRHRIIFTNAGHPRKGTEVLLDAVKLLLPGFPDIQVGIAGGISRRSGYGRYIRRRINEMGKIAIELGQLNAKQMAEELAKSHVFVSPSFIDNSPNAVCEAQLIGMPIIATYTGGVPSLIKEGRTGLFFPTGDAPMLASVLQNVFEDDELAKQLGDQAHKVAVERHDPNAIVRDLLVVYNEVLKKAG